MADDQTAQPAGKQRAGNSGNGNDGQPASVAPANGIGLEALKTALQATEKALEEKDEGRKGRIAEIHATIIPDHEGAATVGDISLQYSRPRVFPTDESPYVLTTLGVKIKI